MPSPSDSRQDERIRANQAAAYRQAEAGHNGYNSQVTLGNGPAAAFQLAAMKRDPNGSYRDSAYGGSYAAVPDPRRTQAGGPAVFPSPRPTGAHASAQEPISDRDWQAALRSEADRYASRSSLNPHEGQAGWESHAARYQAGPDRARYDTRDEELAWTSNRPRSYREDQGIPGNPRLY